MISLCPCGQVNLPDARFCLSCGRAVGSGPPPGQPDAFGTPFVGRSRELGILLGSLDEASAGTGGLVMLAGEAGIGKTRLAQTFATLSRGNGAVVLWGSCYDGGWSPPYGPWIEALGGNFAIDAGDDGRFSEPGAGLPSRRSIASRSPGPELPSSAPLTPDEERFRLFDAVGQRLLAMSRPQPVVLILDDLHWADADSLQLLRYVARLARRARLLIVGAYRDPSGESPERDILADILTIARRETNYRPIVISGFTLAEVGSYTAELAGRDLPRALLQAVFAETAGNPLYVREVFRHLVEEEKILLRSGRWSTDLSISELGIPEGIRQLVARRTSRLSPPARRMLSVVAALTGGFEFQIVLTLLDDPEEVLLDALDEALRAGLLRVKAGSAVARYDFAHAIVRHAIYQDLNPERRARLHRQIALALERQYAGRERAHASELSFQYHASASLPGRERGVAYCFLAADQAKESSAYERVASYLRMARDLVADGDLVTRAVVLRRLTLAEAEALLLAESSRSVEGALEASIAAGDDAAGLADFLADVGRALKDGGGNQVIWKPLVERGLALAGDRHDLTWARLTLLLDRFEPASTGALNVEVWSGYDPRAVEVVRAQGVEDDYSRTLEPRLWNTRAETNSIRELARTWRRPTAIMRALGVVANDLLTRHGAFREAAECLAELLATAERCGSIPGQAEALVQLALVQAELGAFALAEEFSSRARLVLLRLGPDHRLQSWVPWLGFCLAYYLDGDWEVIADEARYAARDPMPQSASLSLLSTAVAAFACARAGKIDESDHLLARLAEALDRVEPRTYTFSPGLAMGAATAWTLGLSKYAADFRRQALAAVAAGVGDPPLGSHSHTIARMSYMLGDTATASEYFSRARIGLVASGRSPLAAFVDYDEALALSRASPVDRPGAISLFEAAASEFNRLGMLGWESRARDGQARLVSAEGAISKARTNPNGLTRREVEVLRLIAAGQTTREIAIALVVSRATVERHVSNIYGKIDARGRADATAYALRNGLA